MATTDNGWPASPNLKRRRLVVAGVEFVGGIVDDDDVALILGYVAQQFHERVEPLRNPGCWGFSYRENRNNPNSLSRHSGGIAIDANAPAHPNGVATARTFSAAQIAEVHRILAEVDHVVRWGGDYTKTVDAMHFEIDVRPTDHRLAVVAASLRKPKKRMRRIEVRKALDALRKARDTAKTAAGRRKAQRAIDQVKKDFPGSPR